MEGEASTVGEQDYNISQVLDEDQSMDAATETQLLRDELKRAKLDVEAYSTTLTSLQQTLRAMEKSIQELRGMQSLPPTKSRQKQPNYHNMGIQHSTGLSTDIDLKKRPQHTSTCATVNQVDLFNLVSPSAETCTKSRAAASRFEVNLAPDAPISLYKGTCTSYLCRSYFSPSGSSRVFVYDHEAVAWSELPECPNTYFSLVTVNGVVTAVGGWVGGNRRQPTNALLSLLSSPSPLSDRDEDSRPESKKPRLDDSYYLCTPESDLSWSEHFPAMPTKRGYPAAVYHNHSLIVAGGDTTWLRDTFLTAVEVLDTVALQWYTVSSLPMPLRGSTAAAVCGVNQHPLNSTIYLLGGWDKAGNSVYACSLQRLLSTAIPHDPKETLVNAQCSCCWKSVTPAPFSDCSCVSLGNKLFVFGGRGWNGEGSECIHAYHEPSNQWECVGKMSKGRSHPLVAKLGDGKRAVVVGGIIKGPHVTNSCEAVLLLC